MEISSTNSIYSTISSIQTTTLNKPKSINDLGFAISENKKQKLKIIPMMSIKTLQKIYK